MTQPGNQLGAGVAPKPARRKRRTQQERSAETRALLVDVTIECLAELGYAGTSAHEIAERAGLSRGAQLHHFGTKPQLLVAAMEQLFRQRLAEFRDGIVSVPADAERASETIRLLWRMVSGPAGYAYLELAAAARTDPELREPMRDLTQRMDSEIETIFSELFTSTPESEASFELAWTGIFALLEGLALERVVRPGEERLGRIVEMLAAFAPLVMKARE